MEHVSEHKVPADLRKALSSDLEAKAKWDDLTGIARRDFISWIEGAKQSETRTRRIEKACDMLLVGKRRPCCYSIVPMGLYTALNKNSKAKTKWKKLSPNEKRDFIAWIESAKDQKINQQRIAKVCSMIASGKTRS